MRVLKEQMVGDVDMVAVFNSLTATGASRWIDSAPCMEQLQFSDAEYHTV